MAISRSAESILSLSEMIADTENHFVILVACCIEKGPTLGLLDNDQSRCSKWRAVSLPFSRTSSVRLAVVHITGTLRWVGTSSQQAEKHKTRLDSTHFNHWEHSFHKGSWSSTCSDTGVCVYVWWSTWPSWSLENSRTRFPLASHRYRIWSTLFPHSSLNQALPRREPGSRIPYQERQDRVSE